MILAKTENKARAGPEDVPEDVIRRTRALHVDNFQPEAALAAARIARRLGVPVTMDLEGLGANIEEYLHVGDYVIVPEAFVGRRYVVEGPREGAAALYEEIAPHGGRAAVVTCGVRGSFAVWSGGAMHQPAYRVKVIDTTGCGDVFHGAFALGVARGWPMERILPFSSAVAALKCRELGGRAGIPTGPEVEEFLASAEPVA